MAKFKTPLMVAVVVIACALAAFTAWKSFFSPYIPPPAVESGYPEPTGAPK